MKKFILIVCAAALAACQKTEGSSSSDESMLVIEEQAPSAALQDGVYKAQFANPSERGNIPVIEITVANGIITEANYDELQTQKDNAGKKTSEEYNTKMTAATGIGPGQAFPEYERRFLDKQGFPIDAVSGATDALENFRMVAEAAMAQSVKGDTSTAMVQGTPTH